MQVSVEKLDNPLGRKVTISIPPDWIDSEVDKQVNEYVKNANLPGFRPGKVPFKVMVQRYGQPLADQVVRDNVQRWVHKAAETRELKIAGFTGFHIGPHTRGSVYEFSVCIEVLPEIPDSVYENLPIVISESEVGEEQIQNALMKVAVRQSEYEEIEVSDDGKQRITLQYRLAELTDEDFTEDMFYYTGLNPNMKQFDKVLEGVRSGDRIETEFDPNSFMTGAAPSDELKRSLLILIHKVEKFREDPQVDEALAEKLCVKGGLEELRKEITAELERVMEEELENLNLLSIQEALYKRNEESREVVIPCCMYLGRDRGFGPYPVLDEEISLDLDVAKIEERKKSRLFDMVADHIYHKDHDPEREEEQFKAFLTEQARKYEYPDQYVQQVLGSEYTYQSMKITFIQKKAIQRIMETAKSTTEHADIWESELQPLY